ncbi:hypothetical protein G4B88_026876 [Cannabis sativa]|uniref:Peptidase S8/S53 domain-containing protein n=1 Tax=Cannabis sativa TaxID=3483 RepID=A0A7J6E8G2_CANSA|nr:hypothetical protein G4B88_026876 [Cannabis sativa]
MAQYCSSADILKAFDEAIHDGVDVLSLSIGFKIPMFSDVDERDGIATGSFHAMARGITVVCGAGNDGPSAQTVQNTAPWILTVAASSIDRAFVNSITLGNNKTLMKYFMYRYLYNYVTMWINFEKYTTWLRNMEYEWECSNHVRVSDDSQEGDSIVMCWTIQHLTYN